MGRIFKEICFVTSYFGDIKKIDIAKKFKKHDEYDYFFFTNIDKKYFGETSWEIIKVDFEKYKIDYKNNVLLSRYFKFRVYKYLKNILNRNYKIIFHCDCYFYPLYETNWKKLSNLLESSQFGIIQYIETENRSINHEIKKIIKKGKETKNNMIAHSKYLNYIDNNIDLNKKYGHFYENAIIGFHINSKKVINFLTTFWKYYISEKNTTYRDQPLWNFIYIKENCKPIEFNDLINCFSGKKKINRNIIDYNKLNS